MIIYTVSKRPDRNSWQVSWYDHGKKTRDFPKKAEAEAYAASMNRLARLGASSEEVLAAKREAAGTGFPMDMLIRAGLEAMRASGASRSDAAMTFADASALVIEEARRTGARERTLKGYTAAYRVINRTWGAHAAVGIGRDEVEKYLAGLKSKTGGEASIATKGNHLCHIRMALRQAGVSDPLRKIVLPADERVIRFLTVEECRMLFAACPKAERGLLAAAMFAGIRPEGTDRVLPDAVSVAEKRIRIIASADKSRDTHILDRHVLPDVLWLWLKKYPYAPSPGGWPAFQRRMKRVVGRWFHDALRHTAATYYCALHGVPATGQLLTHQGVGLVRKHYAGAVETKVAKEFYKLTPAKIRFLPERNPRARCDVTWPEDKELEAMLRAEPGVKVAARLGCSDSALTKRCRVRGIKKPGRGHWTTA